MNADEMKNLSRGFSRDMSPKAIAHRIDIVTQLRNLGLFLATAQRIGPAEKTEAPTPGSPLSSRPR
jgi:hypothetical protein